jgi:hypothetical protein
MDFTHLHTHSEFSLLDGAIKISDYMSVCKESGMTSIGITDHGSLAGTLEFYRECKKANIKPLLGCLLAGQEIITKNGIKNIEDIKINDEVLTHLGRYRPVSDLMQYDFDGDLFEIELSGTSKRTLKITGEHPILIRSRNGKLDWQKPNEIKFGRPGIKGGNKYWNSYVCFPKIKSQQIESINCADYLPNNLSYKNGYICKIYKKSKYESLNVQWNNIHQYQFLDEDFAYFLGLYCAEGSVDHTNKQSGDLSGTITFTFNINEDKYANFILNFLKTRFKINAKEYLRDNKSIREIVCTCKPLAYILSGLCGTGAKNKKVPNEILEGKQEIRNAFLKGLVDGDGKAISKNNQERDLKVSSRNLIWGFKLLLATKGFKCAIWEGMDSFNGKKYKSYMASYAPKRKYTRSLEDENYIYIPIKKISKTTIKAKVYNFEVKEDNSYVSDYVLHNCEGYLTLDDDGLDNEQKTRDNYHIILFAKDMTGWKNLLYLSSNAYQNNFYYKPRISIKQLQQHADGLICNSACLSSLCCRSATYDSINQTYYDDSHSAERWISTFKEMFQGRFYLELMQSSQPEQIAYNEFLVKMGKKLGIKNIITADAHYTREEDEGLHELLMAMQSKKTIDEYRKDGYFRYENCFLRSPEQMLQAAKLVNCEEAFHNTLEIADQCKLELELGKYRLPVFDITSDPDYQEFKSCIHA